MADKADTKVGFSFIENPQGHALTGEELLRSSISQNQEREAQQQQIYAGIAIATALVIAAIFIWRRRYQR